MRVVVDTNVPLVANGRQAAPQASPACVITCVERLRDLQLNHVLVLDDAWHILHEYGQRLRSEGQPGVGDAFLKWVLTNWTNPRRCELVPITRIQDAAGGRHFAEFPIDEALQAFDPADQKFVAVALTHPARPPILNAVDSDWWLHQDQLARHGVMVDNLCPDTFNIPVLVGPTGA